ncbi:hypothetical protein [Phenylobacterium sp.]|uniref:hypothetical protein n=1 Tax=Phenylobacterium sp. TaxID=1871053 RepID=UPI0027190B76|nr:hypothetical protein [Phenylobacterium sp.]MDO8798787.1 hypothetical protein [Phenylobacterium sp.]
MIMTSMRVFPSLFIGRRDLVEAVAIDLDNTPDVGAAFTCGACDEVILTGQDATSAREVVVKCRCGEYNQL